MDFPKQKIGQIANMFGISSETIRHYERKGLITPYIESNSYRYYDWTVTAQITMIRSYLSYGYTLDEIRELLHKSDLNDLTEALEDRAREIEEEIQEKMKLLQSLRIQQSQIYRAQQLHTISLKMRPAFYLERIYTYGRMDEASSRQEIINEILSLQPVSTVYLQFDPKEWIDQGAIRFSGICIPCIEWKRLSGLPDSSFEYLEEQLSIHTEICLGPSAPSMSTIMGEILQFADQHAFSLDGDVFARKNVIHYQEDGLYHYFELWVPVKTVKKKNMMQE